MVSPKITLTGPYKIDGRVLVLPIQGEGKAEIKLGKHFTWFNYYLLWYSFLE